MKMLTALLAFAACSHAYAQWPKRSDAMLVVLDTSAPLAEMAQPVRKVSALHAQATLPVTPAARAVPPKGIRAGEPPAMPLPLGPAQPPMAQVQTGGTRLDVEGIEASDSVPAHVSGAVGETHYVQTASNRIAVYDKADGALLLGPIDAATVFAGLAGSAGAEACRHGQGGPAQVQYDKAAQRWIFSRIAWKADAGPYYACLAVSISPDALDAYYRYAFELRGVYADDPMLSVWTDAYYFSFATFRSAQGGYLGPRVCGFDRATVLAGSDAQLVCWDFGSAHGPVRVADFDGTLPPPAGSAAWLLALNSAQGSGEQLTAWRASYGAAQLSAPMLLPVAPFTPACEHGPCIRQPAPGEALSAPGDRLIGRVAYRNLGLYETLLATHNLHDGVRWYEIRVRGQAASVYQQGTFGPDANSRWMGSIAMDKAGNIALGYSVSGAATPPGIRYTGRTRADPPGRMENEETIVNGSGVQVQGFGLWSGGSAMSVDPGDDCRFWYAQQYIAASGSYTWRTRIASFAFRNCE